MLPSTNGSYLLHYFLDEPRVIEVGRLGTFQFPAGHYYYCGSAHGPGGLAARLGRHLRTEKRLHWHIDYFARAARLLEIFYVIESGETGNWECAASAALAQISGAWLPARGFGARDCRSGCGAHLIGLNSAVWVNLPLFKDLSTVDGVLISATTGLD